MKSLLLLLPLSLLTGCAYDEVCRDIVAVDQNTPQLTMERCGLRHCVTVSRSYSLQSRLKFRLPNEAGTFRLEDLRAEECTRDACTPVTGSITVREVVPPAEQNPVGRLDSDAVIDAPSSFAGSTTWRYSEHWDESCRDVTWPIQEKFF